ncbi:MAG: leucine--tRNA ligase [Euryarchaeota archaeon]|nr:leucine--tRNA ligase [Euryarchaeota archaeon]
MKAYDPGEIERKWQARWTERGAFSARPDPGRERYFVTVAWPYPSGPMHVGHARTYTVPDVIARYKRMKGHNCLFPMGWHLTGSPIVGATQRIRDRDERYLSILRDKYGISEDLYLTMTEPMQFADYWINRSRMGYKTGMTALGYSIDWGRECTSLDPHFSKMVGWQYRTLRSKGLVTTGSHPVKFCPRDNQAVTDHDLLDGEGVGIMEFTLIKYRLEGGEGALFLPAATLRPETVFGLTNIWLHPDAAYVVIETGGERWLVSREAAPKLAHQDKALTVVRETTGREFIGRRVRVPLTDASVPILPATFVKPDHTSGVVGSVPAHAPFDLVALRDLQRDGAAQEAFGLDRSELSSLSPIQMIAVDGHGAVAVDLVEEAGIRSQAETARLDDATNQAYKLEFSRGVMAPNTGRWSGLRVSAAKEQVKRELLASGLADTMYEFSETPVTCRCGAPCVVKTVTDQWFIRYSDPEWKQEVLDALERIQLVPPESRTYYRNVVDWLNDWPCTRRVGLGTRLPWDETGWIIESLSDSTIYMAYYTLVPLMRRLPAERLSDAVFDFVFLGRGDPASIAAQTGLEAEALRGMRTEFAYWYPQNHRVSANELIPNHLTFMIFHHLALFPRPLCPEGIVNLGLGVLEGRRMSSSKGVVFAVAEAVERFGADVTRLYLMYMCEPWQDFDWRGVQADAHRRQMERFFAAAQEMLAMEATSEQPVDSWLESRLQRHVLAAGQALEGFQTRRALQHSFFLLQQDVRWYLRRGGRNRDLLRRVLDAWVRLLAPFVPHVSEEIWEMLGGKGFVSDAPFPAPDEGRLDPLAEFREEYLSNLLGDIAEIIKVTKIGPRRMVLYCAPQWKWEVFRRAMAMARGGHLYMSGLMKSALEDPAIAPHSRELARFAQKLVADIPKLSEDQLAKYALPFEEHATLAGAGAFLSGEFGCEVEVHRADAPDRYDPQEKAGKAVPLRPAIFLE